LDPTGQRHFLVTNRAARLAIVVCAAVAVRAAMAQQPPPRGPLGDPYAPQPQAQAPAGYSPNPPPTVAQRYPLPQTSATYGPQAPPVFQFSQPGVNPPPLPPVNQSLRYPLPAMGGISAPSAPAAQPSPTGPAPSGPAAPPTAQPGDAPRLDYSPPQSQAVLFQPGQIVARVDDKTVLYCDVLPTVNLIMEPLLAKAKSAAERDSLEAQREALTRNVIQQVVQNKMLLLEFERGMPGELRADSKKRAESEGKMRKEIRKQFDLSLTSGRERVANASQDDIDKLMRQDPTIVRLALLMKERHLESPGELDAALRQFGTSLDQQVKDYGEYMMGMEAARTKIGLGSKAKKPEVTHQEMLDYYQAHAADYYIPAKAKFEILSVRFANFGGNRQAAERAIVEMGNAVYFGAPLAAIARKHSQEPRAQDGGAYEWVTPGSLASKPVDRAVFTLEVGKLSQVIEDEIGLHIVRVTERQEAGQVSFIEAQPEIKLAIEGQRRVAEQQKYLTNLRTRTKLWTIFDPPAEVASQPTGTTSR
jgi:parvulin-like peptidyl-prolyl isomerase